LVTLVLEFVAEFWGVRSGADADDVGDGLVKVADKLASLGAEEKMVFHWACYSQDERCKHHCHCLSLEIRMAHHLK